MFANVQPAPPDPILGLTEAFQQDPRPGKINLGVGVYKDADGSTPVLQCVKEAERRLVESEKTKGYLPIDGSPQYAAAVQKLIFGGDSDIVTSGRAATSHTPGGTGGLRVVGDYLAEVHPGATLWLSDPTWANHPKVFEAAGVTMRTYPYFDAKTNALDFDAMLEAFRSAPAGDVVLLHGCCHNPTGVDPTAEQWEQIADVLVDRDLTPIVDFAYQGFGGGFDEDAEGLRIIARKLREYFVCSSFSKNFGLYNERVGALTVVAETPEQAAAVQSNVKIRIRTNYSNPPAHGGAIVAAVLQDEALTKLWTDECKAMRDRINDMRRLFADALDARGVSLACGGNGFITQQNGMFSFSGLDKEQVAALKEKHAVYIVGSGRINVAGMSESNMDRLCGAIADVC